MCIKKALCIFTAVSTLFCSQTAAFANNNINVVEPAVEATTSVMGNVPSLPFTIDGNLTLDDNLTSDDKKEFYTVHSKNGNEFFIVVDKASNSNNVYFLNAVDETDLLSLVNNYQDIYLTTETTTETTTITTETTTTNELVENVKSENKEGSVVPVIIIVVAVVGTIGWFKLKRKKSATDDDDELNDEYEDELDSEGAKSTDEPEQEDSNSKFSYTSTPQFDTTKGAFEDNDDTSNSGFESVEEPEE